METIKPFNTDLINPTQEQNLRNLAALLLSDDKRLKFDMWIFTETELDREEETVCNSTGCPVGWNTLLISKKEGQDYNEYGEEHLISNYDSNEWEWLFNASWTRIDNTKEGAAKRILYLLENGLPANSIEIMKGTCPLPY